MKQYTVAEASAQLGVDPKTFLNWRKKHRIATEKGEVDGREHLISSEELKYLAKLHGERKRKKSPQTPRAHHGKTRQELESEVVALRAKLAEAEAPVKRLNENTVRNAPLTHQDAILAALYSEPFPVPTSPFIPDDALPTHVPAPVYGSTVTGMLSSWKKPSPQVQRGHHKLANNPHLPERWESVNSFAEANGIGDSTWRRWRDIKLFDFHVGKWHPRTGAKPVEYALDPEQQQELLRIVAMSSVEREMLIKAARAKLGTSDEINS